MIEIPAHNPFGPYCEALACCRTRPIANGAVFCKAHFDAIPGAVRRTWHKQRLRPGGDWARRRKALIVTIAFAEQRLTKQEARDLLEIDRAAAVKANDTTFAAMLLAFAAGKAVK